MSDPYPDVVARFYDPVYAQIRDGVDNAYYRKKMAAAEGPVLEVGVGTGRLFSQARQDGADVYGIDLSPAMVERCRRKLPAEDRDRVSVADAVRFETERRFALVVAPFRVLSHVPEPADQVRLLDSIHDVLTPEGAFVFDLFVPNLKLLMEGLPEVCDFDGEHAPGRRLRRFVSSSPADMTRQTTPVSMRFEWQEAEGGQEQRTEWAFDMRFYFRYELEHLVARSRLSLEAIYGDFDEGPLTADSAEYVVVARRG